jgi:DNA repair protein RecO (recombination protein O)
MEWLDRGIVLSTRRFGETGSIASLLTREHGRHAGLVRGRAASAASQTGMRVAARWRARLADQLGTFTLEADGGGPAVLLDDPLRLSALVSACALADAALPERAPHPGVYDGLEALINGLAGDWWDAVYVQWEIGLLAALGFGLELERCAATGANDALAYVSPRTGRAVSLSAAEPYRDRLLPLPGFLIGRGEAGPAEIAQGLDLTGHFIERALFAQGDKPVPAARARFVERCRRRAHAAGMPAPG